MDKDRNNRKYVNDLSVIYLVVSAACFVIFMAVQGSLVTTMNTVGLDIADKMDSMSIASSDSDSL